MNYGAAGQGQYGQPMPGQQMPTMGMPGQRPMMMQPGMPVRPGQPMYPQAGMPNQPPMMAAQGVNMYAGQRMAPAGGRMDIQTLIRNFPPDWQMNIARETNPERKKGLIQSYYQQWQAMRMQQQGVSQGQAMAAGPGMGMYHQGMPGAMPQQPNPAANMIRPGMPMHHMQGQMRPAQHAMIPPGGTMPQQQMPGQHLLNVQQNQQTVPSPQIASLSQQPTASGSPAASFATGMSPQVPSVKPPTPQAPASVEQRQSEEQRQNEYNALVKSLKERFQEQLQRINERCNIDGTTKPPGLERLLEILEKKRNVTLELLQSTIPGTEKIIEHHSLSHPVIEELRRIGETMEAETSECEVKVTCTDETTTTSTTEKYGPDPWYPVRHLFIKVPDHVMEIVNSDTRKRTRESSPATSVKDEVEPPKKKPMSSPKREVPKDLDIFDDRGGNPDPPELIAKHVVDYKKYHPRTGRRLPEKYDDPSESDESEPEDGATLSGQNVSRKKVKPVGEDDPDRIKIDCGERHRNRYWMMPAVASKELASLPWKPDEEDKKHWKSPEIVVCFDSPVLFFPPLRVLVPQTYPAEPPVVLFDRSFPEEIPLSKQLSMIFERNLSLQSERTLTCFYHSFETACTEIVRVRGPYNGPFTPNEMQKQIVA